MMPMARRLFNKRLQNAAHLVSRRPQFNVFIRKDLFPCQKQLNEITRLYEYVTCNMYNRNPYLGGMFIPLLMPKTCYCTFKTDYMKTTYNLAPCRCSPLESGIAIHIETLHENPSDSRVCIKTIDNEEKLIYLLKLEDQVNIGVQTHIIYSDYFKRHNNSIQQTQLTFRDTITRRPNRTFGEKIGVADISIDSSGIESLIPMEYDIGVIQASDKELGIDQEWDKIRTWAKDNGP